MLSGWEFLTLPGQTLIHSRLAPSRCWYSFTFPERMESLVCLGRKESHTNIQILAEVGSNRDPWSREAEILQLNQPVNLINMDLKSHHLPYRSEISSPAHTHSQNICLMSQQKPEKRIKFTFIRIWWDEHKMYWFQNYFQMTISKHQWKSQVHLYQIQNS